MYVGGIPANIDYVKEEPVPNLIGCLGHVIKDGRPLSVAEDVTESVSLNFMI